VKPTQRPQWSNWAGNQRCAPRSIERPGSEDEVADLVRKAAAAGERVKVVGAGHSFTPIACTDGRLLDLRRCAQVRSVDSATGRVTIGAGITLEQLNDELQRRGLAMANLGDIAYQSIAGATSTATHGTGLAFGNLSSQIVGLRLVTADGSVLECDRDQNADVFDAARVGLGALGIVTSVTLQCVPAFNLHAVEEPAPVDDCTANWDDLIGQHDHYEFFWVPHTRWALTKTNTRTHDPVEPRPSLRAWRDDYLLTNYAFGLSCRIGRRWPRLVPTIAKQIPNVGRSEYTDISWKVFASPRLVKFYETEWAVPVEVVPEALERVRRLVEEIGLSVYFPVEVRAAAGDDIPLSTAYGRDTGYIACHVYKGATYDQYFQGVERIMGDYGGRPHWGKMHFLDAERLSERYPRWDEFVALRNRLDPDGVFANSYLERVLGPYGA
jgi:L-gulonolactone oxidase